MAYKHINTKHKDENIIICSDSLAALKSINNDQNQSREDITNNISKAHKEAVVTNNNKVTLVWIPSHIGIEGNEIVDELANKGRNSDNLKELKLGPKEIKSRIKSEITIKKFQAKWDGNINSKGHRTNSLFYEICPKVNTNIKNIKSQFLLNKLRTGARMGEHEEIICHNCGVRITSEHLLLKCGKFNGIRQRVKNNLNKQGLELTMFNILRLDHKKYTRKLINIFVEAINYEIPI